MYISYISLALTERKKKNVPKLINTPQAPWAGLNPKRLFVTQTLNILFIFS